MHDWQIQEALQAASQRHQRELRKHTGYPRSNGLFLSVLCECGKDFRDEGDKTASQHWESHLVTVLEAT